MLYFNGAVDDQWETLGNWWTDSDCTSPAASLPTSNDDVFIMANCLALPPMGVTVANMETNSHMANGGGTLTVLGSLVVNDSSGLGFLKDFYAHDVTVYGSSYLNCTAIIIDGVATFYDFSQNFGPLEGTAVFNHYASNAGSISGDATFNDQSILYGSVNEIATFNDYSAATYTSVSNATFNDFSAVNDYGSATDSTFNDYSILGAAGGTCYGYGSITFNDNSSLGNASADTNSNVTFNNNTYSYYYSYLGGAATFNDVSVNYTTVNGYATFNNYSSCQGGTLFSSCEFNDYSSCSYASLSQYGGAATFSDHATASNTIMYGPATFNDNSHMPGANDYWSTLYINGPIPISVTSAGSYPYSAWMAFVRAGLGVNGSNILGII